MKRDPLQIIILNNKYKHFVVFQKFVKHANCTPKTTDFELKNATQLNEILKSETELTLSSKT